jgi:hypothetical protein
MMKSSKGTSGPTRTSLQLRRSAESGSWMVVIRALSGRGRLTLLISCSVTSCRRSFVKAFAWGPCLRSPHVISCLLGTLVRQKRLLNTVQKPSRGVPAFCGAGSPAESLLVEQIRALCPAEGCAAATMFGWAVVDVVMMAGEDRHFCKSANDVKIRGRRLSRPDLRRSAIGIRSFPAQGRSPGRRVSRRGRSSMAL